MTSFKSNSNLKSNLSISKKKYEFHINDPFKNEEFQFEDNNISTTKYNIITFLPKALLFQFIRYANIYFLVIAIIQLIPIISPLNPMTAVAPLVFVLLISMIREGIEDYNRYRYDSESNNEIVNVYRNDNWIKDVSSSLMVGEVVLVMQNQAFPADLILLDSNMPDGICYVETATLDGEKTLKMKISNKTTSDTYKNGENYKNYIVLTGYAACDPPNSNLYKFDATISLTTCGLESVKDKNISLNEKQLLLKGIFFILG